MVQCRIFYLSIILLKLHDKSLKITSTLSLNSRLASRQLHETSLNPDLNWGLASPVVCLSLALRLWRICSDSNTFELRAKELTNQLHRRGYLKQDIASAIDKTKQRSRDALLSYRPKSAEVGTILPFVLTYHPDLPKVRDIVDKNWSIIEASDELKDIYQSKPVMAFRRPKSLPDFLVRARLKPNSDEDNKNCECRPCGRKRCQCCKMKTSAGSVKSSPGATVRLRQNTDCTTENVVYLISYSSCNKQYVGETKGPLKKRMNGHRDDRRHRRFERSPTAEHFHSADHDFLGHASVCCLEHNKEWSDSTRKLRESYCIRRLQTLCVHLASIRVTDSIWSYGRTPGVLCCCRQSFRSLAMF